MLPSSEGSFEIKVKWKEYHVVSINTLRTVYLLEKYTPACVITFRNARNHYLWR